jgi:predicted ATPase
MKKKISLGGYKAIGEVAKLNLAPITLLIGPNGSGKSSVINMVRAVENIVSERIEKTESGLFDLFQMQWEKEELIEFSKNVFGLNKLTYNVYDSLENPIGKFFKEEDFNKNLKEKNIHLNFPILLDYFRDRFEVSFSYSLRENLLLGLDSIAIVNSNSKNLLVRWTMEKDFATRNPNKNSVRNYYHANVFLDVEYVLKEIKDKSIELRKNDPSMFKEQDFDPDDYENNSHLMTELFNFSYEKQKLEMEEAKKECAQLQSNLFTTFADAKKCELNNDESFIASKEMNYNFIKMVEFLKGDGLMFQYAKQDEENLNFNEYSQLTAKNDFEGEFFRKIKAGKYVTSAWDYPAISIFLDELDVSNSVLEKNGVSKSSLNVLGLDPVGLSPYGDFIINKLIFDNFKSSLAGLKNYFGDHKFVGTERLWKKKNSVVSASDAQEFLEDILSQKSLAVDETPSLNFLNYHLKQFGMDMIGGFSSLLDYYTRVLQSDTIKGEIGYGHQMLLSIISKLALPSQYVDSDHLGVLYNSDFIGMTEQSVREMFFGKGRLFIIEEPESNLHPNNQTKLADLFIDAAWKFGHQFLIETHSEYLVRKLQFYIASGKIKSEDVQIYYFDKVENNDLNIVSINILSDGSLSKPFSSGFLDESDKISLELFIARKNNMN